MAPRGAITKGATSGDTLPSVGLLVGFVGTFVSKLMHEHLATEARHEMWAGRAKGSVTCGCGCVLSWTAPDEVSRLQWHMLECGMTGESAIRTRWHAAVRAALAKRIKRRDVVDGAMACWAMTAGRIHTAADDQSRGWRAPPMIEEVESGRWFPDPAAPPPCFGSTTRQSGAGGGAETDSDETRSALWTVRLSRPTHRHARSQLSPRRGGQSSTMWIGMALRALPTPASRR